MLRILVLIIALLMLALDGTATAQSGKLVQVFLRVGGKVVQLFVEKKADLTIGVLAGTIVEVGKSEFDFLSQPKKPSSMCTLYGSTFAVCPEHINPDLLFPYPQRKLDLQSGGDRKLIEDIIRQSQPQLRSALGDLSVPSIPSARIPSLPPVQNENPAPAPPNEPFTLPPEPLAPSWRDGDDGIRFFTLTNHTGLIISRIFVRRSGSSDWDPAPAQSSLLSPGEQTNISFTEIFGPCWYDIMIEFYGLCNSSFSSSCQPYVTNVNVCRLNNLTFHSDGRSKRVTFTQE